MQIRCRDRRRRPQRADLRRLSRHGRAEGEGRRAAGDRRRRGGNGGILPRLPQLDRGLHRQPAQPEGDQRPAPPRTRAADRRAAGPEFPACAGRPLSPVGRRADRERDRQAQPPRRRRAMPPSTARSTWRSTCCANWCCGRRRTWRRASSGLGELIKAGALGRKLKRLPDADLRTLYGLLPDRRASTSTTGSRTIW